MAKICTYCGGEMHNTATTCDHCGKPFEKPTSKLNQNIFVYYIDAIKHYTDFYGRTKRKDFWMFMLANLLIVGVSLLIGLFILAIAIESVIAYVVMTVMLILTVIYSGFILFPFLAISVRRLHDQDRSGVFLLFNVIPWVGNLAVIILLALPGTPYDNRYGPYTE